jgi:hypothetical protein
VRRVTSLRDTVAELFQALEALAGPANPPPPPPPDGNRAMPPLPNGPLPSARAPVRPFPQRRHRRALEAARRLLFLGAPPDWLGAVVAVSASMLPEILDYEGCDREDEHMARVFRAEAKPRAPGGRARYVLITHGDADAVVPRADVQHSVRSLARYGADAELFSVPGKGHAMLGPSEAEARAVMGVFFKVARGGAARRRQWRRQWRGSGGGVPWLHVSAGLAARRRRRPQRPRGVVMRWPCAWAAPQGGAFSGDTLRSGKRKTFCARACCVSPLRKSIAVKFKYSCVCI